MKNPKQTNPHDIECFYDVIITLEKAVFHPLVFGHTLTNTCSEAFENASHRLYYLTKQECKEMQMIKK